MIALAAALSIVDSIGRWWLDLAWQFPLLVVGACLLERILPCRWNASAGGFFWGVLLLVLVVPPVVSSPTAWRHWVDTEALTVTTAIDGAADETAAPMAATTWGSRSGSSRTLAVIWVAGAIAAAALALARHRQLRRELDRSWAAPPRLDALAHAAAHRLGIRSTPRVLISNRFESPALVGTWRPVVALPPTWTERSDEAIEHALLHEFTHVARRDPWLQLALTLLQIVYWYQPFLALARRRLTHYREVGCDRAVVRRLGEEAAAYRRTLLDEARALVARPRPATSLGFLGVPASVVVRLEALQDPKAARSRVRRGLAVIGALALAAVLLPAAPADATQIVTLPRRVPVRATPAVTPTTTSPSNETTKEISRVERIPTPAPAAGAAATTGCLQMRYAALYEAQKRAGVALPDVE